jgi:hypothetical protein
MTATKIQYQVYVDGTPRQKFFSRKEDQFMNGVWDRFNRWAQTTGGAVEYVEDTAMLGSMGWRTKWGVAELRRVA